LKEIKRRLAIMLQKLNVLKIIWHNTNTQINLRLLRACIFPVATYGCESWTLTQTITNIINSFELKCYRNILRIPWIARVKKNDILTFLNIKESWLVNNIFARKLKYYGHVKRHSGMVRYVIEDKVPGIRGNGQPRRRWFQDIKETLKMTSDEVGILASDKDSFRRAVMRATYLRFVQETTLQI
jgi:hypothetical protein